MQIFRTPQSRENSVNNPHEHGTENQQLMTRSMLISSISLNTFFSFDGVSQKRSLGIRSIQYQVFPTHKGFKDNHNTTIRINKIINHFLITGNKQRMFHFLLLFNKSRSKQGSCMALVYTSLKTLSLTTNSPPSPFLPITCMCWRNWTIGFVELPTFRTWVMCTLVVVNALLCLLCFL